MNSEQTKQAGTSLVLCYLTDDWQSRIIEGPRNKGETLEFRFGITASNNGWSLTEFRKNSPPLSRKHASRFADLVPTFKTEANINPFDGMRRCQEALETTAKLKANIAVSEGKNPLEKAIDLACEVDAVYQTNYAIHDDVRQRFFGNVVDDSEE